VLKDSKFNELCAVLGISEQCCLEPDKKLIEKAFRKKALKSHPDKGGDTVVFKKLNDAYNKLIGHIEKLEHQSDSVELANSILIEISKTSVSKWQEKLKTRYGWFKSSDCKNIIFDGPYKQYMGRSSNTGNITVVLYEDPPDTIPKLHVRSTKYMAWIAEQMLPVRMHVEKGKIIQFDQWRIAHLAEFGICNFSTSTPATPAPEKKKPNKPKTPKAKRREEREAAERCAKVKRDSDPNTDLPNEKSESENVKINSEPHNSDSNSRENCSSMDVDEGELHTNNQGLDNTPYICGQCEKSFNNRMDYFLHNKICISSEDLEFPSEMNNARNNELQKEEITVQSKKMEEQVVTQINLEDPEDKLNISQDLGDKKESTPSYTINNQRNDHLPKFECEKCNGKFTNMVWYTKHMNICQGNTNIEPVVNSDDQTSTKNQKDLTTETTNNILPQINSHKDLTEKNSEIKHSKISFKVKDREDENNKALDTEFIANNIKYVFESPTVDNLNTNAECKKKKKVKFENKPQSNDDTNKLPTESANNSHTRTDKCSSYAPSVECGKCDEMFETRVLHTEHINTSNSETREKDTAKTSDVESEGSGSFALDNHITHDVMTGHAVKRQDKSIVSVGNESEHTKTNSHAQIINHKIKEMGTKNKLSPKIKSLPTENWKKTLTNDFVDSKVKINDKASSVKGDGEKRRIELNINEEKNTANKKKNMTMLNIAHKEPNFYKSSTDVCQSQAPHTKPNVSQAPRTKPDVSQAPSTKPDVSQALSTQPEPIQRKRSSLVYVVGPNTFAGNPNSVRTIKQSVSSPAVTQQCKVK